MVVIQLELTLDDVAECPSCQKAAPAKDLHQIGACYRCFLIEVGAINPEEDV